MIFIRQQAIGSSENTGYQAVSVTMMSTLLPIAYCLLNTPCCLHFLHDPHEVPAPDLGNIITAVAAADHFLRDVLHHGDISAPLYAASAVEIRSYAHIVDTDDVNHMLDMVHGIFNGSQFDILFLQL